MPQNRNKITLLHIQIHFIHCAGDPLNISLFITSDILKNQLIRLYNTHLYHLSSYRKRSFSLS